MHNKNYLVSLAMCTRLRFQTVFEFISELRNHRTKLELKGCFDSERCCCWLRAERFANRRVLFIRSISVGVGRGEVHFLPTDDHCSIQSSEWAAGCDEREMKELHSKALCFPQFYRHSMVLATMAEVVLF